MGLRKRRLVMALLFAVLAGAGFNFFSGSWELFVGWGSIVGCTLFLILAFLTPSLALRIDRMEGREFEEFLGEVFDRAGYKVEVTQASGDFGADLLIEDDAGYRIAVQAKRYNGKVGLEAVQQVAAAVPFYGVDEGWVVTNSVYTEAAYQLAEPNRVRLIAREELFAFAKEIGVR